MAVDADTPVWPSCGPPLGLAGWRRGAAVPGLGTARPALSGARRRRRQLAAVGTAGWRRGVAAKRGGLGPGAADVQTSVAQLDALTGGSGRRRSRTCRSSAKDTPFALDDATAATKRLVAAGVDLQEIPGYLNDIGNVAAATGVPLAQIATVFAQMESKGKVTFEETQQLAEAGIPVWQTLAEKLGLTVAEVQKLATEGKLGADAIPAPGGSLAEQFPTAMGEQAATVQRSDVDPEGHRLADRAGSSAPCCCRR